MFTFLLGHLSRRRPQPVAMAQDPWGNDNDGNKKNDQPPDLDELFNKLLRRNPRRNNGNSGGDNGGGPAVFRLSGKIILLILAALFVAWLSSGVYTVRERENGVETFLGRYSRTTKAGLNWHVPVPFGQVNKVDVTSISSMKVGEFKSQSGRVSTSDQRNGQMLTSDENIVEIGAAVQYRIRDAKNYLFQANQPEEVLRDIVISAIREVVGSNTVDDILIEKRGEWPQEAKQIIDKTLEQYNLGFEIVAFELQDARAPVEVRTPSKTPYAPAKTKNASASKPKPTRANASRSLEAKPNACYKPHKPTKPKPSPAPPPTAAASTICSPPTAKTQPSCANASTSTPWQASTRRATKYWSMPTTRAPSSTLATPLPCPPRSQAKAQPRRQTSRPHPSSPPPPPTAKPRPATTAATTAAAAANARKPA